MSPIKSTVLLAGALFLQKVAAHGFVSGILAEGKYYVGQSHYSTDASPGWLADNGDNGFANGPSDESIICHKSAVPGSLYVAVNAGDSLEIQWNTWPSSHKGPMLDYLAPCGDDCTTVDKASLQFTKIDEAGLITGGTQDAQKWASDELIANNNTWVSTIPASIAPGKYVLRHETIALHSAGSSGGAQFYPQCINIEVSGSGTDSLSSGTPGESLYTASDPGVLINIYQNLASYDIPGPAVMAGGGSGTGSGTSSASTKPSTSAALPSSTQASSSVVVTSSATTQQGNVSSTFAVPSATSASSQPTGAAPSETATIGGRKFVCYEEL